MKTFQTTIKKVITLACVSVIVLTGAFLIFSTTSHAASSGKNITVSTTEKTLTGYNVIYNRHLNLTSDKAVVISMYGLGNRLLWRSEVPATPTMTISYYVGSDVNKITVKSKKGSSKIWYSFTK